MITLTLDTSAPAPTPRAAGRALSRLLSPFAKVEPHEAESAVALIGCWLWGVIGLSREHVRREQALCAEKVG